MNIHSKFWVYIFLFYGVVCFALGLFGYLARTRERGPLHSESISEKHSLLSRVDNNNLMAESEQFVSHLLTGLSSGISNAPIPDDGGAEFSRKAEETVPAFANASPMSLLFCYPGYKEAKTLEPLITRIKFNLKTSFTTVRDIPITRNGAWNDKLVTILARNPNGVLLGINVTHSGFSERKPGTGMHLYCSIPDGWQRLFLTQVMPEASSNLDSFILNKQKVGTREILELSWPEAVNGNTTNLEQTMNLMIRILEEIQASQAE